MFLKGYSMLIQTNIANARAAQVEVFNGQDTRDGVEYFDYGNRWANRSK